MPITVTDEQIRADILHRLHRKKKWGKSHTSFDNLQKGVPSHLKGKYLEIGKELVKNGFLIAKPTHYGTEVSLNPGRRKEIIKTIRKFM